MTTDDFKYGTKPDRFDSRDVIERIAELEAIETPDEDETQELADLRELAEDQDAEDWEYGAFFIAEWDFENHARELADDIGAIDSNASWPNTYIDWERAAAALMQDYTTVEFRGATYYYR